MVGVAGKSKGCGTCRRRRVKCDETKPTCERCTRARVSCEGYERYPVFLTRTQKGWRKRTPLEEVKSKRSPVQIAGQTVLQTSPFSDLAIDHANVYAVQITAWFQESFSRTPPVKYALQNPSHWLEYVMEWKISSPGLQKALLAASVIRYAKSTGRPDVLRAGRQIYGSSLALLQRAVVDPMVSLQDDVLASTCVLVLYELFDPTDDRLDAWLGHLTGVSRVLQHRGPHRHRSEGGKAILEHARYLLMFWHLASRKTCFLSEPQWLSTPWEGVEKSVEQTVFDNGLRLAGIFERCDSIVEDKPDMADPDAVLEDCIDVFHSTENLLSEHVRPAIGFDLEDGPGNDESLGVRNPAALLLSITAGAIKLGACDSASRVALRGVHCPSSACEGDLKMLSDASQLIAREITDHINTCMRLKIGSTGASRMLLALRLALHQFRPFSPEYDRCKRLIHVLKGKGNRFDRMENFEEIFEGDSDADSAAELVRGNSSAIATRWDRLSDSSVSATQNSCTALWRCDRKEAVG